MTTWQELRSAPVREPLTLLEAKEQLFIEHNEDDPFIMRAIAASRSFVEQRIGRKIIRQQWRTYLDYGLYELELTPGDVREIQQVQYIDADGATQTLSTAVYELDYPRQMMILSYNQTWPSTRSQRNAAWVDVWAGYYDETSSPINLVSMIPDDIKQAMLMLVADMYEHRTAQVSATTIKDNRIFDALLQPHRLYQR